MVHSTTISSGLLFPGNIADAEFGELFFSLLHDKLSVLMPSKYGSAEPLRNKFRYELLSEALARCWDKHFLWQGAKGNINGIWSIAPQKAVKRHSTLFIYGEMSKADYVSLLEVYKSLSNEQTIDYGYVHFLSTLEKEYLFHANYDSYENYNSGVVTHSLRKGLPELGWITLFGKPYSKLIGIELLSSSPVYKVEIWESGIVCVQLTPEFPDTAEAYSEFGKVRQGAMSYLGSHYFMSPAHCPITPQFFNK
jgi:hypothetical protein